MFGFLEDALPRRTRRLAYAADPTARMRSIFEAIACSDFHVCGRRHYILIDRTIKILVKLSDQCSLNDASPREVSEKMPDSPA